MYLLAHGIAAFHVALLLLLQLVLKKRIIIYSK